MELGQECQSISTCSMADLWQFEIFFKWVFLLTFSLPHPVQTGPRPTYLKKSQIIKISSIYVYKVVLES
jgi:hypothetical protein